MSKPLSLSDKISKLNLMASGIKNNLDALAAVSLGESDAKKAADFAKSLSEKDAKQERLKSDLKECTADLEKTADESATFMSRVASLVKATLPQERWKEFGINAKK